MDSVTIALGIGLIVSLLFTELFGLSAGGMIVPGYLALHLHRPLDIGLTLAAAVVSYVSLRLLSRGVILYGRRRVALALLLGFLWGTVVRWCVVSTSLAAADTGHRGDCVCVIGYLIPGLIALWFDRQGTLSTLAPLTTSAVMVRLVLVVLGMEVAV